MTNTTPKESVGGIKSSKFEYPSSPVPQYKKRRTLFNIIMNKIKEKPPTESELIMLKMEKKRQELKRDIQRAKTESKNLKRYGTKIPPKESKKHRKIFDDINLSNGKDNDGSDLRRAIGGYDRKRFWNDPDFKL